MSDRLAEQDGSETERFEPGTDRVWCQECDEPRLLWSDDECPNCGNETFRLKPTITVTKKKVAKGLLRTIWGMFK